MYICPVDSSFVLKFKMAGDKHSAINFILHLIKQNRRQILIHLSIHQLIRRRRRLLNVSFLVTIISFIRGPRTCRRFRRNMGWWGKVWDTYSDPRFKKTFMVSRTTFTCILNRIKHQLERKTSAEDPIVPELRLGVYAFIAWDEAITITLLLKWWV